MAQLQSRILSRLRSKRSTFGSAQPRWRLQAREQYCQRPRNPTIEHVVVAQASATARLASSGGFEIRGQGGRCDTRAPSADSLGCVVHRWYEAWVLPRVEASVLVSTTGSAWIINLPFSSILLPEDEGVGGRSTSALPVVRMVALCCSAHPDD